MKLKNYRCVLFDGSQTTLKDLSGKKGLVLYFYPKDATPGCTQEACNFRDSLPALKKSGFAVVGVSPDSAASHARFRKKQELNFPLIADTERTLITELGLWVEKKLYGRVYMGVARATYLLDANLKVIKLYNKVNVKEHAAEILADIKELK
ncbi:MAG: peroxiredoxin [Spirochaetales bacterium]|nr:peroxiredoxin [Spirochaetales bacterium]